MLRLSFIPTLKEGQKWEKKGGQKWKKKKGFFSVLTFFIYYSGCSCYPEKVGPRYPYVAQVSVISADLTIISFKYYQMDPRGGRSLLFFSESTTSMPTFWIWCDESKMWLMIVETWILACTFWRSCIIELKQIFVIELLVEMDFCDYACSLQKPGMEL